MLNEYNTHKSGFITSWGFALLIILILWQLPATVIGQQTQTTDNKADQNLKSSARVNPVTLAMEFSLPFGKYPGRGGNSTPISLNYSSKVWTTEKVNFHFESSAVNNPDYDYIVHQSTDVGGFYGRKSAAGWTSSLQSPVILSAGVEYYNQFGDLLDTFLPGNFANQHDLTGQGSSFGDDENFCIEISVTRYVAACNGLAWIEGSYCCLDGFCAINVDTVSFQCLDAGGPSPTPTPTPSPGQIEPPAPPQQITHIVKRVRVQMPDGSSHEFRKDDRYYDCSVDFNECNSPSLDGTYLSVDGTRMRLERGQLVENVAKDVLYLSDGSRYVFPIASSQTLYTGVAEKFIDSNGNVSNYSLGTHSWTDTLGRNIQDPLPNPLEFGFPGSGTQQFNLKGIDNTDIPYSMTWSSLTHAFEDPANTQAKFAGQDMCSSVLPDPVNGDYLFANEPDSGNSESTESRVHYIRKTRMCASPYGGGNATVFNPTVLAEVKLPDGEKYQFRYNQYGEITKIKYPTGGYERFTYGPVYPMGAAVPEVYAQGNRGVTDRYVSYDGVTEQHWQYASGSDRTLTTAPDQTTTERVFWISTGSSFGFEEPRAGMARDERTRDANGNIRSRTLTEWTVTPAQGQGAFSLATRDPRPTRSVSIIFENGRALASMASTDYETPGESGSTVPNDPAFFARLNVKRQSKYHYITVDASAAASPSLSWSTIEGWFQPNDLAAASETDYSYSADYKDHGIVGLPIEARVLNALNPGGPPIAVTQTVYDNALPGSSPNYNYAIQRYGTGSTMVCNNDPQNPKACWENPNGSSGPVDLAFRGLPTTTRVWNSDEQNWIETYTQYDQFGNVVRLRDPVGNEASTEFSSNYKYAFPTRVTTPAPDPTNVHGTNQTSSVQTVFDFTTGLPLSVTDHFGQITTTEYDASLRPIRVNPVVVNSVTTGPVSETVYGQPNSNGQLPPEERFVKVRKQLDANNWDEATTWFDGLGRTIKTQAKDSQGDVFVETHYDEFGRADRVTNPYRQGDTIYWSKTRYDELGRAVESYAPTELGSLSSAQSLGITSFTLSTAPNYFGTVVETTDAAGKKSRSITNALGQLIVVEEPDASGNLQPLPESTPLPPPNPTPTPAPGATPTPTPNPTPTPGGGGGCLANCQQNFAPIDYPSYATYYTYNAQGKMVQVTQGVQNRYFKYDSLGRLIRVSQPEQEYNQALDLADPYNTSGHWTAGFTYDVLGNVLTATDANGVTITNTYDRAGRVTTRAYSGEVGQQTPAVSFYYDGKGLDSQQSPNFAKGKLTKVENGVSQTRYTGFDNFGRLLSTEQRTPLDGQTIAQATPYVSGYQYNLSGALVQETYPSGRVVKNEFEADGDLKDVIGKKAGSSIFKTYVSNFSYTAAGGISQMELGNGKWETAKFNSRLQVYELGLGNSATDASLWKTNYDYGELDGSGNVDATKNTGNIAKQTLTVPGASFVQAYNYDSLYRLTQAKETSGATQNWIQNWNYDRYGNRTGFSNNVSGFAPITTTPSVDPNTNRFDLGQGFTYDKNGNVVQDHDPVTGHNRQFIFNGDNKQVQVKDIDNSNQATGTYFYDGEGKRVKKVTEQETTVFVYSSGKLIAEYSTQLAAEPHVNYTTTDHLGSPRIITDELGQVKSRRDFMPFGEDIFATVGARSNAALHYSTSTDDLRQKFTGYQKDSETSLDFAEARMYENRFGRFTAVDPFLASGKSSNPQTFNRYNYVINNPLRLCDPNGLDWWDVINNATGERKIQWFDDDPDEDQFTINQRWTKYVYHASDNKWYALDPNSEAREFFFDENAAKWQYGKYTDFDGDYNGVVDSILGVKDVAELVADIRTNDFDGALGDFTKISLTNGVGGGVGRYMAPVADGLTNLGITEIEQATANAGTALIPKAATSLGRWGETRLGQILGANVAKNTGPLMTSLGKRVPDYLVDGIAYEAKAGVNVGLTSTIRKQILKDVELRASGQIRGAEWHFFQGAQQDLLDFLAANNIKAVVH